MGSHQSTAASKTPRASKLSNSSSGADTSGGGGGGADDDEAQPRRLAKSSRSSPQTNGHSRRISIPLALTSKMAPKAAKAATHSCQASKSSSAARRSNRKAEKIISSLDKKVHQLVRERASGLIGGDKMQLKNSATRQQGSNNSNSNSNSNDNNNNNSNINNNNNGSGGGNYNYHYAHSFGHLGRTQQRLRGGPAGDSDVFIYPSNYRDMNECQKCARDNKICNCNVIEAASITRRSSDSSMTSQSDYESLPWRRKADEMASNTNYSTTGDSRGDDGGQQRREGRRPDESVSGGSPTSRELVGGRARRQTDSLAAQLPPNCGAQNLIGSPGAAQPEETCRGAAGAPDALPDRETNQMRPSKLRTALARQGTADVSTSCVRSPLVACRSSSTCLRPAVMGQSRCNCASGNNNAPCNDRGQFDGARSTAATILALNRVDEALERHIWVSAPGEHSRLCLGYHKLSDATSQHRLRAKSIPVSTTDSFTQTTSSTITTTSYHSCHIIKPLSVAGDSTGTARHQLMCLETNSRRVAADGIDYQRQSNKRLENFEASERDTSGSVAGEPANTSETEKRASKLADSELQPGEQRYNCKPSTPAAHCSVSQRRRNLSASKLNHQQIDENNSSGNVCAPPCEQDYDIVAKCLQLDTTNLEGDNASEESNLSIQGYSPILSGVRDYIENVNPELRLHHAGQPLLQSTTNIFDNLITSCEQQLQRQQQHQHQNPSDKKQQTTISVVDINGNVPAIELQPRPSDIIVQTSMAAAAVVSSRTICAAGTIVASPSGIVPDRVADSSTCNGTPKKSIFDGASKDEILEYLEDARERVPEVLIAADDVMVISENELIVVNQLDPSSPATPISIVEAGEGQVVGSSGGEAIAVERVAAKSYVAKAAPGLFANQLSNQSQSPDSEEIEATSMRSHEGASAFGIDKIEDTETAALGSNNRAQLVDSNSSYSQRLDSVLVEQGLRELVESVAEQSPRSQRPVHLTSSSSRSNTSCGNASLSTGSPFSQDNQPVVDCSTVVNSALLMSAVPSLTPDVSNIYECASRHAKERRKSTSETCSSLLRNEGRHSALQLLLAHHQPVMELDHSKCNHPDASIYSISSSSSPPSSNSTSTCASQTSGNCTAASTFYASPSLSCSSPYLASGVHNNRSSSSPRPAPTGPESPVSGRSSATPISDQQRPHAKQLYAHQLLAGHEHVRRNDSGLGADAQSPREQPVGGDIDESSPALDERRRSCNNKLIRAGSKRAAPASNAESGTFVGGKASNARPVVGDLNNNRLNVIEESAQQQQQGQVVSFGTCQEYNQKQQQQEQQVQQMATNSAPAGSIGRASNAEPASGLVARPLHSHYATMNRFNSYLTNRRANGSLSKNELSDDSMIEFQCLDCDQLICVDHARMLDATNEIRMLREHDITLESMKDKPMSSEQLERAYVVAMNGLPLCKPCEKKRTERKEIVSEFVETELKYGRDLKIIHDEFYRPMQIAGLLNKDQINGVFLNLDELIMAHCRFADRLGAAISEALAIGDTDYNTVNIGKLFVESADMLHTFESYCIRQGSAACLLARLAKEKELLRIFLRVSQMENTLLRRMNLAAFLMVPVQRVTKYPLLLNRLYKVTPYHHKDREALRDAQLKVELHLEHINQQTKGISATNKIWRRISNLSAVNSNSGSGSGNNNNRRGMINAEDIGYIKLRKVAMDILKWDRDETQFIHSGKINFSSLNEYLTKQRPKPMRYMAAHALLIVLGKPNWKYRPDLVKPNLDYKLMVPTTGGAGIKEAALLLFREKNGRFVACREPLFLSNCVLSADCSQFNNDQCLAGAASQQQQKQDQAKHHNLSKQLISAISLNHHDQVLGGSGERKSLPGLGTTLTTAAAATANTSLLSSSSLSTSMVTNGLKSLKDGRAPAPPGKLGQLAGRDACSSSTKAVEYFKTLSHSKGSDASAEVLFAPDNQALAASAAASTAVDSVSMSSLRSLPEEQLLDSGGSSGVSPPLQTPRSYSLALALPRTPITTVSSNSNLSLTKSSAQPAGSPNLTILNQLMSKVNNYHHGAKHANVVGSKSSNESPPATTMAKTMSFSHCDEQLLLAGQGGLVGTQSIDNLTRVPETCASGASPLVVQSATGASGLPAAGRRGNAAGSSLLSSSVDILSHHHYNHHFFHNHQPYGDYEESFELHERISKESLLLRADTPLKTRYWLQMLRYHAKDLGQWRTRRNGLANIMMMRQE